MKIRGERERKREKKKRVQEREKEENTVQKMRRHERHLLRIRRRLVALRTIVMMMLLMSVHRGKWKHVCVTGAAIDIFSLEREEKRRGCEKKKECVHLFCLTLASFFYDFSSFLTQPPVRRREHHQTTLKEKNGSATVKLFTRRG